MLARKSLSPLRLAGDDRRHDRLVLGDDLVQIHDQGIGADDVVPYLLLEKMILVDQALMAGDRDDGLVERQISVGHPCVPLRFDGGDQALERGLERQDAIGSPMLRSEARRHAFERAAQRV